MLGNLFKNKLFFSQDFKKIVYVNGKSILSLSQMIGGNRQYIDPYMSNFYIKQHTVHQVKHEGQLSAEVIQKQQRLLKTVLQKQLIVRCIISPEISQKQMNLNINKLKINPLLNHLINLSENCQFKFTSPQILINSFVHIDQERQVLQSEIQPENQPKVIQSQLPVHAVKHGNDPIKQELWINKGFMVHQIQQNIKRNIVEIQKLFVDGLHLNLSFMLSKRNLHHPTKNGEKDKRNVWLNSISKKSKAIHTNIVQNDLNVVQTVYQQGHKLHHLFVSSFNDKKQQIGLLADNKRYDLRELMYVLSVINFNGKLVIDCQKPGVGSEEDFINNIEYLDKVLRDIGYKKTLLEQIQDQSYISAL